MYKEILQEDLDKCKVLHDKIKNHEFRKNPQLYLLDDYAELFEDVDDILMGWDWVIDDCGRIHTEDTIYESYEEFLREWI